MASALVKPGLVTGLIITGGLIGLAGSSFKIKIMRVSYRFYSPGEEVTGDSDEQPLIENNLLMYGNISLQGGMVAGSAIGLKNLIDNAGLNPVDTQTYDLGGGSPETLKFKLFVEDIRIKWNRTAAYAGVSILGKMSDMTNTLVGNIEV